MAIVGEGAAAVVVIGVIIVVVVAAAMINRHLRAIPMNPNTKGGPLLVVVAAQVKAYT